MDPDIRLISRVIDDAKSSIKNGGLTGNIGKSNIIPPEEEIGQLEK